MTQSLRATIAAFFARDLSDRLRITEALGLIHLIDGEASDFDTFKRIIITLHRDNRLDDLRALLWPEE